ncbi:MAG TPA: hypothetical protein VH061_04320 [Solirubrobacteraceae bacterium]|jgi:hypothetical protein|nr:hypothetical protein [Solirubrobacteraceae bacterium]
MKRLTLLFTLALLCSVFFAPPAHAAYGLEDFSLSFAGSDGSPLAQAGAHPFAVESDVRFHTIPDASVKFGELPDGATRNLDVQLPAGLVGDPTAVPRCSSAGFLEVDANTKKPNCPDSSAVGVIVLKVEDNSEELQFLDAPVYNLAPDAGAVEKLGFNADGVPVAFELVVSAAPPYNVVAKFTNTPQPLAIFKAKLILWGDPASSVHDQERGQCIEPDWVPTEAVASYQSIFAAGTIPENPFPNGCKSDVAEAPFITLPATCEPLSASYLSEAWQEFPVVSGPVSVPSLSGCGRLGFGPSVEAAPTTSAASSSSGLDFSLNVHDEGLTSPGGLAQSDIRRAEVTLPEGMTVNPSAANGLGACKNTDLANESLTGAPGSGCPESSKLGTVEVETPLLEETLDGSIFVAQPYENQSGTLLAAYVVIKSPKLGILIKQPLKIVPNPVTGQLTTIADEIPQLPFSHFRLKFKGGEHAPLTTPPDCGSHAVSAVLTPWDGGAPVTSTSTFEVTMGPGGASCAAPGSAFGPQITAGTTNNTAGSFSSFYMQLTRSDTDQEFTNFSTVLPFGLSGDLTGIPYCPEAAIAAARAKSGIQEQGSPSCPAASQLGHTEAGAGVGSSLTYVPGKLYLAGPYQGDPFSLVSITPAVVGPFDLGNIVLRFGLHVDPHTAQASIDPTASEPIPHILNGIVTHIRDIRVSVDRPNFTFNPTSCEHMGVSATLSGLQGANATIASPFQAAGCANLKFAPTVSVATKAKASRNNGQSLSFKIAYPKGAMGSQAWFKMAKFTIPKQLPARLTTIQKACPAVTFETKRASCPAQSIIGHAVVHTEILPVPLEGNVYFVSHGGEAFPDAVMDLNGDGVHIELDGKTLIRKGVTSATFSNTPDVPFESIEVTLPAGRYSEFGANLPHEKLDYCGQKLVMPTQLKAQNGLEINQNTPITVTGCPKSSQKKPKAKKRHPQQKKH